jgi:hypothetical protein
MEQGTMAKTAAEYQRAYRERKAEQAKLAGDPTDVIKKTTFDLAFQQADFSVADASLASVGIDAPTFDADTDDQWLAEWGIPYRGSIGRAERMVGAFLDAATELSTIINAYKRKEIADRIQEIETSDLSDPNTRKQALADIVRLQKMLEQLDKQVRWTFPQWKVTAD